MSSIYIGRLAPSPTGLLHLGHAATFLTAYDRARAAGGELLLRIDDLDPQRGRESFVDAAREDLTWLGPTWTTELRQSARLPRYREALEGLLAQGLIYACTCTRKDLQRATQAPHGDIDDEPVYTNRCRPHPSDNALSSRPEERSSAVERPAGMPPIPQLNNNFRFRTPDGEPITFIDGNCGLQRFTAGQDFGDFVVWRKDGLPSYQLASVVDDADTGVTEVVRGRDLLKSTARQILLQRALQLRTPSYFHTGLLLNERGERLAKRHDALSLRALRDAGVTPTEIRARVESLMHHTV